MRSCVVGGRLLMYHFSGRRTGRWGAHRATTRLQRPMLAPQHDRRDADGQKARVPGSTGSVAPGHSPPRARGLLGRPRRHLRSANPRGRHRARRRSKVGGRSPDPDGEFAGDAEHVGELALRQSCPKIANIAVSRIGGHQLDIDARAAGAIAGASTPAAISLETPRSPGCAPAAAVRRQPSLRQVQLGAEQPRAHARPQRRGHGDLAIANLAERARVLPLHAHEAVPCLGKPVSSRMSTPWRSGTRESSRRHTGATSHGACVMKC